jgi:phosphate/sulfate permease
MFLGTFVSSIVRTAAMNANLPQPEFLSTLSQYAIVIFALVVSLVQLGIATILVSTTFNILFGAICLGLALAFGLGGKDAAARYIEELKRRYTRK